MFIAKRKITSRQNVQKLPHQQNAENFWVQKGSVSIALVRTNHRNAKAPRSVNIVVRHHTSICSPPKEVKTEGVLTAHQPENKEVVYPIILVEIDRIKTHALLDTGAGSSYASNKLINLLNKGLKKHRLNELT